MPLDIHKPKGYRRAWDGGRDLTKESHVSVTARCIGCGMTRDIGQNEIALGDHPCCASCGMPMIAESAQRKGAKRKGRR